MKTAVTGDQLNNNNKRVISAVSEFAYIPVSYCMSINKKLCNSLTGERAYGENCLENH